MISLSKLTSYALTGALCCTAAIAQTRFCLGGDLDHLSPAQKSACSAKMQAVRNVVYSLGASQDWHYVVVCGEDGWKQYAAYSLNDNDKLLQLSADTNLRDRETFFRERDLDVTDAAALRLAVAREMNRTQVNEKATAGLTGERTRSARQDGPSSGS